MTAPEPWTLTLFLDWEAGGWEKTPPFFPGGWECRPRLVERPFTALWRWCFTLEGESFIQVQGPGGDDGVYRECAPEDLPMLVRWSTVRALGPLVARDLDEGPGDWRADPPLPVYYWRWMWRLAETQPIPLVGVASSLESIEKLSELYSGRFGSYVDLYERGVVLRFDDEYKRRAPAGPPRCLARSCFTAYACHIAICGRHLAESGRGVYKKRAPAGPPHCLARRSCFTAYARLLAASDCGEVASPRQD